MRIRVDEHNDSVASGGQCALQRTRFPSIFLTQQTHARIDISHAFDFRSGLVARSIVHHDDLEFAVVIGRKQRAQSAGDHFFFVVSGHHYADRRYKILSG